MEHKIIADQSKDNILVSGKAERGTVRVSVNTKMASFTMEAGQTTSDTARVDSQMHQEHNMRETSKTIRKTAKALQNTQTVTFMSENTWTTRNVVQAHLFGLVVTNIQETGKMISEQE